MIRALLISLFALLPTSCMQANNSSAGDVDKYSRSVNSIFVQNCNGCHNFQGMSLDSLIAAGYVVRGDANNSKIYYRLNGSNGANGPKDMPQGGQLSPTDVAAIESWIAGL